MTWYLSDFWSWYRYFWRTGCWNRSLWAWACSKDVVVGGGARAVPKDALVHLGARYLQDYAKEHGWMASDKLWKEDAT